MIQIQSPQPEGKLYETGGKVLEANGNAILGICLGNSYFTKEKIAKLLQFVKGQNFKSVTIFVPPITDTYRGLGYDDRKAKKKSNREFNNLRNHVRGAMDEVCVGYKILKTDDIEQEKDFKNCLAEIRILYESNTAFKEACNEITSEVLHNRVVQFQRRYGENTEESKESIDVEKGVEYLFKLLAFRLAAPQILDCNQYTFLYYEEFPLLADLLAGNFGDEFEKYADAVGQVVYIDTDRSAQKD